MTFGDHLRREAGYVLEDVNFQRSPTQARLLRYLVDRALAGGPAPTQYEIAVEALGKPEDFDLANDSYPRVQVSRLRTNLDNYYARTQPHDGLRLKIEQGQYEIALAPYQRPAPPTPTPAHAHRAKGGESTAGDREAGSFATADATPTGSAAQSDAQASNGPAAYTTEKQRRGRAFVIAPIAFTGLVIAAVLAWGMSDMGESTTPADFDKPTITLRTDLTGLEGNGSANRDTAEFAVRLAEILLTYSLVSNTLPASADRAADYTLTMNFVHEPAGTLKAYVSFGDADGEVLFNELVEHDPARPERFAEELRSAIGHITSPTGEVAQERRDVFGDSLESGFACFVTIENRRADGGEVVDLVDSCIKRHPQSEYVPYFRARRAFAAFQAARLEGEPIRASGPAWQDLQLALQADPFNSFANLVVGKVLIAQGDCEAARANMEIAFEQATTYPALRAVIDAEAPACPSYAGEIGLSDEELRAMIAASPAPDALHHLYMLVAALASNDMQSAKLLVARPSKPAAAGREQGTVAMLHRAIDDPEYARANSARLRADIAINVWGTGAVDLAIENLTREAQASQDEPGGAAAYSTGTRPTSLESKPYR